MRPPTTHAAITRFADPRSPSAKPEVVKIPAPTMLAMMRQTREKKPKVGTVGFTRPIMDYVNSQLPTPNPQTSNPKLPVLFWELGVGRWAFGLVLADLDPLARVVERQ